MFKAVLLLKDLHYVYSQSRNITLQDHRVVDFFTLVKTNTILEKKPYTSTRTHQPTDNRLKKKLKASSSSD